MIEPAALGGTRMRGRLDRLDTGPGGQRQLIDYKTGSLQSLRDKVGTPLEDTQLAFYAALLAGDDGDGGSDSDGRPLSATYLALDDAKAPCEVPHPDVQRSAAELVQQLGGELARMRQGTPLLALGEGRVCETCEARGLCRRDHWGAS